MDLKCKHPDWEARGKCIESTHEEDKTNKQHHHNHHHVVVDDYNIVGDEYKIYSTKNELTCKKPWCREKIPIEATYDNHMKLCKKPKSKKSTVCPQCNKQFSKVSNLNRHVATVHSILRKYICRNCSRSYYDAEKLDKHLQRCNFNLQLLKGSSTGNESFKNGNGGIDEEEMRNMSSDADDNGMSNDNDDDMDSGEDLPSMVMVENDHYENGGNNVGDDDDESNDNESLFAESRDVVKPLQICNSLFMNKKHFNKTRIQINNDIKLLKKRKRKSTVCPHCNKQFSRVSNLNRHVRTVHGLKKFCCKECNKSYATLHKLNEHLRVMHSSHRNGDYAEASPSMLSMATSAATANGTSHDDDCYDKKLSPEEIFEAEENTVVILDNYDLENVDISSFSRRKSVEHSESDDEEEEYLDGSAENSTTNGDDMDDDTADAEINYDNEDVHVVHDNKNGSNGTTLNGYSALNSLLREGPSHVKSGEIVVVEKVPPHLNGNDESNGTTTKKEIVISDDSLSLKKRVICPHCDKHFSKVSNMNRHIFDVHNIRYICENCSKSFAQPEKLEKHQLTSCNPDKNYKLLKADTALPCMVIEEIFH